MPDYLDVSDARKRQGLKLVLTPGVPGPWAEAAKGVFDVKRVPYAHVRQDPGRENEALVRWTGRANAPVAIFDEEPARSGWAEILLLAERIAPEPRIIPLDARARAEMFGLGFAICGEGGFGWNRRLILLDGMLGGRDDWETSGADLFVTLGRRYGYSPRAAAEAPRHIRATLEFLAGRLRDQRARGSRYLVGDAFTAADIYWATFAVLLEPPPAELCPMDEGLRALYTLDESTLGAAIDPLLLEHRDFVYQTHLPLPIET